MLAGPAGFFGLLVGLLFGTYTAATLYLQLCVVAVFLATADNSTTE